MSNYWRGALAKLNISFICWRFLTVFKIAPNLIDDHKQLLHLRLWIDRSIKGMDVWCAVFSISPHINYWF